MREIILEHIKKEYGSHDPKGTRHHSYCRYPEQDCSCRVLKDITYDTSLIQGGYIDSFSMARTVIFLEKTFNIRIKDFDIDPANFDTVEKMAKLVERYENSGLR